VADGIRWVGLDVHSRESTIAVFDQGTGELSTRRVVERPHELLGRLMEIAVPARMVYEAGPTGYGLGASRAGAGDRDAGVRAGSHRSRTDGSDQDR
jgi:transposase